MAKDKFLLVNLQEDKAKKLAQVIGNQSCRKILDFLAEKEATETEIANKLKIPLSTVHYNLELLIKSALVTAEEFHYSKKGKVVNHYKLANKYIIIAPKASFSLKDKLKSILPVGMIGLIGAGLLQVYQNMTSLSIAKETMQAAPKLMQSMAPEAADAAVTAVNEKAITITHNATQVAPEIIRQEIIKQPNYALWFLIGVVFTVLLTLLIQYIMFKQGDKK